MASRFARYSSSITRKWLVPGARGQLPNRTPARLPGHHQIYPPQLTSCSMIINSAQTNIRNHLEGLEVEKWGWVIYRCTYEDHETWTRFRTYIEASSREYIAESDAPEIASRLEWTWTEDAANLDGISTEALRTRFRAWVADEVARQPGDYYPPVIPRFRYFIKIDQEALQTFVEHNPLDPFPSNTAFVKLVDGNWEPEPDPPIAIAAEKEEEYTFWQEEALEPIDGCTEKDVGWMRIAPCMIDSDFYEALGGSENQWYIFYERPPIIVEY